MLYGGTGLAVCRGVRWWWIASRYWYRKAFLLSLQSSCDHIFRRALALMTQHQPAQLSSDGRSRADAELPCAGRCARGGRFLLQRQLVQQPAHVRSAAPLRPAACLGPAGPSCRIIIIIVKIIVTIIIINNQNARGTRRSLVHTVTMCTGIPLLGERCSKCRTHETSHSPFKA